ncbi:DNA binding protein [Aureococcus anophagefferens]|nr:DNA binding protein [Aureococcus anophagefferens]
MDAPAPTTAQPPATDAPGAAATAPGDAAATAPGTPRAGAPTPDDGDDLLAPCADDCALPARHPRAPPRPMEAYAIFLKTAYAWTSERLKKDGRGDLGALEAIAGEWASLPPSELAAYRRIAAGERERYEREMALFDGPALLAPAAAPGPRGASAFLLFANANRTALRDAHPDKHNVEISKMLGAIWKSCDESTRKPYLDAEAAAKSKFEDDMANYVRRRGLAARRWGAAL